MKTKTLGRPRRLGSDRVRKPAGQHDGPDPLDESASLTHLRRRTAPSPRMHTPLVWTMGLGALASCFAISCSQPEMECIVGLAGAYGFATTFTPKPELPMCATGPNFSLLKGDTVGMEFYNPPTANGMTFDSTQRMVALQANALGSKVSAAASYGVVDSNSYHHSYAMGVFQSRYPNEKGLCSVANIVPAEQDIPSVPAQDGTGGGSPAVPATPADSIKYEWTSLKVYVTPAAPGTQFSADLRYTENGCAVDYHAVGMWPAVSCALLDSDGNPVLGGDGKGVTNEAACDPCADPTNGRATGSGINPNFPTRCDPDLFLCVLAGKTDPPQITTAAEDCGDE